ncbi:hypothetical protein ACROYT_G004894 [Oculina patagonica]
MKSSLDKVCSQLPNVYKASQFNRGDLFVLMQGVTGFFIGIKGKDPLSALSAAIGVAGHFATKCNTGTLQENLDKVKKWLMFGKEYAALQDSSELDFDKMDVGSVPEVMKANLEMNKEGLAADLVCMLEVRSLPQNKAKFQEQIESFFIAGAARIDLIAKVIDLDNDIGGFNFDIANLEETSNAIGNLRKTIASESPIADSIQQMFLDNLLTSYGEMETSFAKHLYQFYKAFEFRTLWDVADKLLIFERTTRETAEETKSLQGVLQLTKALEDVEALQTKARRCFTKFRYSTDIHKWSFDNIKNAALFDQLHTDGNTTFMLKINDSCPTCFNVRLLKMYVELFGDGNENDNKTLPAKVSLMLRRIGNSQFRNASGDIRKFAPTLASMRTFQFNRFAITNTAKCNAEKKKGNKQSSFCMERDDSRFQAMCCHFLSTGSRCEDPLLGAEECTSPFGTYQLTMPIDDQVSCEPGHSSITYKNCKDFNRHLDCGKHHRAIENESLLDRAITGYSERLEVQSGIVPNIPTEVPKPRPTGSLSLPMGWALRSSQVKRTRFNTSQKDNLTKKFDLGETSGQKADPDSVARSMMTARDSKGNRLFTSTEFLTSKQIASFFSRLAAKRRRQDVADVIDEEVDNAERKSALQELTNTVMQEVSLEHPIVYDCYNLCELVCSSKLSSFAIQMLKEICNHFEIDTSHIEHKSSDAKQILTDRKGIGCGSVVSNTLTSPGYPSNYPSNMDCTYIVPIANGKAMKIDFRDFEVGYMPSCSYDYVKITNDKGQAYGVFCRHWTGKAVLVTGASAVIKFHSDYFLERRGFQLFFTLVPLAESDTRPTAECGTIVNNSLKSPGFPMKYPGNMHCVYSVNIPRGMEMKIDFNDFELEDGPSCFCQQKESTDQYHVTISRAQFTDPREQDSPNYECALIWDFDVVPAPATAVIRPREITNDEERYDTLPPVDLKTRGHCNCFVYDRQRCIVDFAQPPQEADAVIPLLEELLVGEDSEESDDNDDEYSQQDEEETDEHEQTEPQQTVEYFPIVGSNWEMRYQEGLKKCYNMQVKKQKVQLRVEHEPDNISDCNALKFEVLSDGQWYILGYCGKKKIPKLKRALYHHQVVSLELCNLRRIYYPVISDFRFTAGINIVKMGTWERDDYNNRYNSSIAM